MYKTKTTNPGKCFHHPGRYLIITCLVSCSLILGKLRGQAQPDFSPPASYPQFVWAPSDQHERFQVAYFRTSLTIGGNATKADLYLFADSRYHLLVNGEFINFGPARSYPAKPAYDHYDLQPYLQPGENVIAVKVFSNGTANFQLRNGPPAFIAWGSIEWAGGRHILNTPGPWRAYQSQAYDAFAPRMTFALGPMEIHDARRDAAVRGWESPGFREDERWQECTLVENSDYWGGWQPRSIPPLTQDEVRPFQLLGAYHWKQHEELYNFQLWKKDFSWADFRESVPFLAYTYIYSPRDQQVPVGIWWGEHFLNGAGPLQQENAGPDQPHRQQTVLDLQEGWNYFFIRRNSFFGKWAFQLAIPKAAELQLSPRKRLQDELYFYTSDPFYGEAAEGIKQLDLQQVDIHRTLDVSWRPQSERHGGNPALDMAWRYIDEPLAVDPWEVDEIEIPADSGTSLIYDFRYKLLGRVEIEYEAPAGTVLDVAFTEDLIGGQANVMKRSGLYMATRHITAGGHGRLETLKPYGLRYLQINVRDHRGAVRIKRVRVHNQIYPFEQSGSFQCSDPLLNKIWDMGWRTLRVCAEDSYTDTPFRERGLYAGDMLPQMAVTLAGSGDLRLVRHSIGLFQEMYADLFYENRGKHPDEIALLEDYPLLTLEALSWYVDRTNDLAFAGELFPNYEKLLTDILDRSNDLGLIHNERVFIEWTQIRKGDVINTAYQAILARSCWLMSRLAAKLSRPDRSIFYDNTYRALRQNIRRHLWNNDRKRYTDGIADGQPIDHYYPISSVWPFLAGITDAEQDKEIFPYIAEELQDIGKISRQKKTTPYGSFYVLGALYEQEMSEVAESFIRKHWGEMVYKHDDTTWENFDDTGIGTLSHAWSAAPTYYLTTQVLGVDLGWPIPSDPDQLVIAPQSATLDWAKGKVPHSKGLIEVEWKVQGDILWLNCAIPDGIEWTVAPRGRLANLRLYVNGQPYD